jgi:hypothetical protein
LGTHRPGIHVSTVWRRWVFVVCLTLLFASASGCFFNIILV